MGTGAASLDWQQAGAASCTPGGVLVHDTFRKCQAVTVLCAMSPVQAMLGLPSPSRQVFPPLLLSEGWSPFSCWLHACALLMRHAAKQGQIGAQPEALGVRVQDLAPRHSRA